MFLNTPCTQKRCGLALVGVSCVNPLNLINFLGVGVPTLSRATVSVLLRCRRRDQSALFSFQDWAGPVSAGWENPLNGGGLVG